MLHIYTDPQLLGKSGVVPWHVSETSKGGKTFLALRSESEGQFAFLGVQRDMRRILRKAPIPNDQKEARELVQIPISFSFEQTNSGRSFFIGRQSPHNSVDIFLGLLLKTKEFPPIHAAFHIARRWGENKPERKTIHVLSYRNAEESYVHFAPQN